MIKDTTVICEKCGASLTGGIHLARHLHSSHGMIASQADTLAKEMFDRYQAKDERIRQAAPELLEACELLVQWHDHCELFTTDALIERLTLARAAIAKARGA